jgi:hypothetical protein
LGIGDTRGFIERWFMIEFWEQSHFMLSENQVYPWVSLPRRITTYTQADASNMEKQF